MNCKLSKVLQYYIKEAAILITSWYVKIKPYLKYSSYIKHLDDVKRWNDSIAYLSEFSSVAGDNVINLKGEVLIDATWENACYWFRYSLLRKALSLNTYKEIGLTGKYNEKKIGQILSCFGMSKILSNKITIEGKKICKKNAIEIVNNIKSSEDIINSKWPLNIPSEIIYDEILRRQRGATVDINHYKFFSHVYEALCSIYMAEKIFNENDISLLVVSHIAPFNQSALIWKAIEKKIPVVFLYSAFSTLRMIRITNTHDYLRFSNAPIPEELSSFTEEQIIKLKKVGSNYIKNRLDGNGKDVGSMFAFKNPERIINRSDICKKFNWPSDRPIIAVYASKWFDTPHAYGMSNFRDFLDWIETTLSAAKENDSVSWLFKAHPCDKWYGGLTLKDVIPEFVSDHIRYTEDDWNGKCVIDAVDGLVTVHGTSGLEFTCMGKPVLCADIGWYNEFGFAKVALSKDEYIEFLGKKWWSDSGIDERRIKAEIFSGCFFGIPEEQGNFLIPDDVMQDDFYEYLKPLLEDNLVSAEYEQKMIYEWFESGEISYHSYKMRKSSSYKEII